MQTFTSSCLMETTTSKTNGFASNLQGDPDHDTDQGNYRRFAFGGDVGIPAEGSRRQRNWSSRNRRAGESEESGTEEEDSDSEDEQEWARGALAEDWRYLWGYGVDERDAGTADGWVKRHPELVRLTGRHPFNCEPPLTRLMAAGFVTPTSLHYVRNHGHVPRADRGPDPESRWLVEVSGLVARPASFSVQQIRREFKPRALPVTLVCSGNRRKEVNQVKQTVGFNWGPAALGTSVWKGAKLCDVLERVGVRSNRSGARFVCFEGAEKLPGHGGSTYGTSLALDVAMDEANDILLAYEQNGKALEPDHGFPIRLIIPGYIGGRMVKWLTRIWVTSQESTNYYHFRDNRVLPSHFDVDTADAQGWWQKPEYIINELNINSVITTPADAEVLPIDAHSVRAPYICKGYAYSGGGRKVTRVEVSLDGGQVWKLCDLTHTEKPTKYGKYFCWCFWELETEMTELLSAKEIVVRAWDQAMNTQPQNLTWNVMLLLTYVKLAREAPYLCIVRDHVHNVRASDFVCCAPVGMLAGDDEQLLVSGEIANLQVEGGGIALTFEHPIRPGSETGGWMMKQKDQDSTATMLTTKYSCSPPIARSRRKQINMAEVREHATPDSAWIVVNNKVYDCTRFLEAHPGGKDSIMMNAGTDCSDAFLAIHSDRAKDMMESFCVGHLLESIEGGVGADVVLDKPVYTEAALAGLHLEGVAALNPKESTAFRLVGKEMLGKCVRRFRFALQTPHHALGFPTGNHVIVKAKPNGKLVMRAYTPIVSPDQKGFFDLLVKIYVKGQNPEFPMGGVMSQYMDNLQVGDTMDMKGPLGKIHYVGRGVLSVSGWRKQACYISMVAGGTGITPLYQIIQAIVSDSQDKTQVSLIYANHHEEDILLRDQLDKWQRSSENVKIWYTITHPPRSWRYSVGRLTESMMREHLFPPGPATVALLCGPPAMCERCCNPKLLNMGYNDDSCFIF